jgi:hypothetical protein
VKPSQEPFNFFTRKNRYLSVQFRNFKNLIVIAGLLFSIGSPVLADGPYRSKLGVDLEGFKTNPGESVGWLTGLRWARYLGDSQAYWGLGAFFGTPNGKALTEEYVTFGGLQFGWELPVSKKVVFEWDLLLGYGQGEIKGIALKQNSYYVAQPGMAVGFRLGQGWKALFTAHYLHMADAKDFSGPSFGFRLEFKSQSNSKFLNE